MNKLYFHILSALLLAFAMSMPTAAQGFYKIYETTYDRTSRDIVKTSNGEYLIVGSTNNSNPVDADLYLMRISSDGTLLWDTVYGGAKPEYAYSMVESHDGNYIIAGYSQSFGGGDYDIYLLKVNASGRFIKQKTVDLNFGNEEARQIIRTSDNKYLVVGTSAMSSTHDNSQVLLLKLDVDLNVESTKEYGGSGFEYGQAIDVLPGGGYLLGGITASKGDAAGDAYVINVNASLDLQWDSAYGGIRRQEVVGLVANSDGSAMLAIRDSLPGPALDGNIDIVLQKIGADGKRTGAPRTFGGADKDTPKTIKPLKDGGFIVGAISRSWWEGFPQIWLIKTNASGDQVWVRDYGSYYEHDHCHMIKETDDGGFIMVGHRREGAIMKVVFLKLTDEGYVGIDEPKALAAGLEVFPNPSSGGEFEIRSEKSGIYDLEVFDMVGQPVLKKQQNLVAGQSLKLSVPGLQDGIYVVSLSNDISRSSAKVMIKQ